MIEKVREIRAGNEERGKMVLVKLESEEDRKNILENKRKLKGKEIRIEKDLTFREIKMKWRLRQIAEEEKRKGERVRVGYGKVWIGNEIWFWNEEMEEVRDGKGRKREKAREERKGRGEEKGGE
ncbi:hypothetical protein RF55_17072 [Lasius niger]|uniref:Uncharacterized protein n=1 Tax=Lasius niger TaxID=67767 RepID=A0A0J7K303_LASNI|nr:hypothetical protein RF55_17072 [Lasius niger]